MNKLVLHFLPALLLLSCLSGPEAAQSADEGKDTPVGAINDTDKDDLIEIGLIESDSRSEETYEEEQWELMDFQDPLQIEVSYIGPSANLEYPDFAELTLEPLDVDSQNHFQQTLNLRINNSQFGEGLRSYRFSSDGSILVRDQQMIMQDTGPRYDTLSERRGNYHYDPQRYRLDIEFTEKRDSGTAWQDFYLKVIDYFIITEENLLNIYFLQEGDNWQKNRTEIQSEDNHSPDSTLFYVQGIAIEEDNFTFFKEQRQGSRNKDIPDYESARRYDIKGRALDEAGMVFYLEDQLLMKNDYVYLYQLDDGIVFKENLPE